MKKIVVCILFTIVLACTKPIPKTSTLIDYIPQDAQVVLKINDVEKTRNLLRDNDFIKQNDSLSLFAYFGQNPALKTLQQSEALLCFSPIGKQELAYTLITKFDPNFITPDSTTTRTIQQLSYENQQVYQISDAHTTFFATKRDSMLIASSSKMLIENAIRSKEHPNPIRPDLKKAYEVADAQQPLSILIDGKQLSSIQQSLLPLDTSAGLYNFSGWISVDATIQQHAIALDGIAIAKDSLATRISIFDHTIPQENQIATVTPVTATSFISYTYDNYDTLKKNLARVQDREITNTADQLDPLFSGISEIGIIHMDKGELLAFNCLDIDASLAALGGLEKGTYRNVPIYSYEHATLFSETLHPLLSTVAVSYYFVHENFIVFANSKEVLQTAIAATQNKTVLAHQNYYTQTMDQLSDESSILMVSATKGLKERIASKVATSYQKEWKTLATKDYPIAAMQLIKEETYAHIHSIFKKNIEKQTATAVHQVATTTLENKLLSTPTLVKNHRTKGMDIAVQDANHNLYLISDKGTIFWKKQIDGPIMGPIRQIDIYKNGRYQLLFNTATTLYLLDRNGKQVAPYPKKFDRPITQPLALFDYDKNKRYRILITQGKRVKMYDAKTKHVAGFRFSSTSSPLLIPPKHIRIGSKDHIVLAEENGKLNILDRLGRTRVKVKDPINFSTNAWYKYQDQFLSITKEGGLIQINTKGTAAFKPSMLEANSKLVATNKTLVTFSENKLTIKDKTIELPYGVYTDPSLFYIRNKIYISITDTQSKNVYMYDSNGVLLPNFPVYGNSAISMGNMDSDPNIEFVVQGESNNVLLYELH